MGNLGWRTGQVFGETGVAVNVAIGSAFRNSAGGHIRRYVERLEQLKKFLLARGHHLRWIATEGDSVDNTRIELQRMASYLAVPITLVVREHGGPVYGSVATAERMKALSYVGNGILDGITEDDDALVYVESDLVWSPDVIGDLLGQVAKGADVVSPLVFAGEAFYDIWAFRKGGVGFSPFEPYHPELDMSGLTEVDSVGSCLVMRGDVARRCRIRDDNALVGFCADARSKGFRIQVDARLRIYHP